MTCNGKKIGIIIGCLNLGGAEKAAALLSGQLTERGYTVYLFIDRHCGGTAYRYKGKIVWISSAETGNRERDLKYRAFYLKNLKKELGIDVSISFMEPYNFANILSDIGERKILSVRTSLSMRRPEWPKLDDIYKKQIPRLYNKAYRITTMTKYQADDLIRNYGVDKKKIRIIPNMTDETASADGNTRKLNIKLPPHSIVNIGRLTDVKAQWQLIRAMHDVVKSVSDAQVFFLGNGENLTCLENLSKALKLTDNIHFEGFTSSVKDYLMQADILVHVSKAEGFVNALLDAFTCGTPVICTDVPASARDLTAPGADIEEKINYPWYAEYGVLVPAPDNNKTNTDINLTEGEKALAEAMIRLLTDNDMREHYRKKSIQRSEAFKPEKVVPQWIDLIENQDLNL
ncbi:MAG: glycosyltransferase [Lachnospiraceae bacterium]|nr:glycosyltransferase [Lachnospiraceae bacterium]